MTEPSINCTSDIALLYVASFEDFSEAIDNEEIAQGTWMAVIYGRDRYRPQARFVTYLFWIARRRTMDRWRKLAQHRTWNQIPKNSTGS